MDGTDEASESGGRPAGIPVCRAIAIPPGFANDDLRAAVEAVGRVHGDGGLPPIPVSLRTYLANDGRGFASSDDRIWYPTIGVAPSISAALWEHCANSRPPAMAVRDRAERLPHADELSARSYAQFVAIRSGHFRLRAGLDAVRTRESDDVYLPRQWDDDDFVGMRRGELHGDRDILVLRPLTAEQRRWLGLGRSIHEVVAEARAKTEGRFASIS